MDIFVKYLQIVSFPRFIRVFFVAVFATAVLSCASDDSYYETYRKDLHLTPEEMNSVYGEDSEDAEWMLGLCIESQNGNWDKVADMVATDRNSKYGSYFHNLCNALDGTLPDHLLDYYQPFADGLFLPVNEKATPFQMTLAGEVWFQLGDMTMAEHATMLGMIFSPHHDGNMFLKRMAEINLVKGDEAAAVKYLNILLNRAECRSWAMQRMPGKQSGEYMLWLQSRRLALPTRDAVHTASDVRSSLRSLHEANPANKMVRDYLLCYELMTKDIAGFAEDYDPDMGVSEIYSQAILAWLVSANSLDQESFARYHVERETFEQFMDYTNLYAAGKHQNVSMKYSRTYWYFYHYAKRKEK